MLSLLYVRPLNRAAAGAFLGALLGACVLPAQAQLELEVIPSPVVALSGDTVTFDLDLVGTQSNIESFATGISITSGTAKFVPTMTGTTVGFAPATNTPFTNGVANQIQDSGSGTADAMGNVLSIAYTTAFGAPPVSVSGTTELGTFQVMMLTNPPLGGMPVTVAPVGLAPVTASQVLDNTTQDQDLTGVASGLIVPSVPGPGAWLVMGGGQGALSMLLLRKRARSQKK